MGTLSVLSVLSVVNSSHSAVGIVLRTTPPGNRELHPLRTGPELRTCGYPRPWCISIYMGSILGQDCHRF